MSRQESFGLFCLFLYLVGVPVTWGWSWGRLPECGAASPQTTIAQLEPIQSCHGSNSLTLFFGSVFWPVYVLGVVAAEVAK